MAKDVTIQVDSNEQKPLPFPRTVTVTRLDGRREVFNLKTERVRLACGDYRLKEAPRAGGVERKASLDELAQNLFAREDRIRFHNAWAKFVGAYEFPLLVVEQPLNQHEFKYTSKDRKVTPDDVQSEVWRLLAGTSRVAAVWPSQGRTYAARLRVGTEVARFLIVCMLDASERRVR